MTLNREKLCRLIPHAGAMCLLDRVERWDDTSILCTSRTHLAPANPLRRSGRLHTVSGVEYAAQAMAVHGGLLTTGSSAGGYLASIRNVHFGSPRLDSIKETLHVEATRLMGDDATLMYRFVVYAGGVELLSGRASVFLRSGDEPQ